MPSPSRLRSDVATLADLASRDLSPLWRQVEVPEQAEAPLRDVLPALVREYGAASATIAADWYDDTRDEAGARGRFAAVPAELPDPGEQALVGWALAEATELDAFRTLIEGGTQRRIANFSRLTISGSAVADPAARGWKRTGVGGCDFCRMLIRRGAVYTAATADFHAHDHCNCTPAPEWA